MIDKDIYICKECKNTETSKVSLFKDGVKRPWKSGYTLGYGEKEK